MPPVTLLLFLLVAIHTTLTRSQTPPNTSPSTANNLQIKYGTTLITPNIELPLSLGQAPPTITYPTPSSPTNKTYILLLIDLTLPLSSLPPNTTTPPPRGITPNRTTRLHYYQSSLHFSPTGTLINTTAPIAYYQPPAPPAGDIPHTYVFYLFEQGAGYVAPMMVGGMERVGFDVGRFGDGVGVRGLVAGNFFRAERRMGAEGSASASGGVAGPTTVPFVGGGRREGVRWSGVVLAVVGVMLAIF